MLFDSYDLYGRTILQESYYGSDDDDELPIDASEEEPLDSDGDSQTSDYYASFHHSAESSPDAQRGGTSPALIAWTQQPEEEAVSDGDSQTSDYYASFYGSAESSPGGPDENTTHAVPTVDEPSSYYYYLSPIPDEPDLVNDSMPGIGYSSQTGGADDSRTVQFNSTPSSESEVKGHRGIILLLCITISAFFVTFCGVTAYARIIQLRLRSSNLFS